jgi:DNA primase
MRLEVDRATRRRLSQERKAQLRKDLNPAAQLQPQERTLRYENIPSALAEEGVIRLMLLDDSLLGELSPLQDEEFSAPLLGRVFSLLWKKRNAGQPVTLASLAGDLSSEEMSHLTSICQKPESAEHHRKALEDYIRIIHTEYRKRASVDAQTDPLLAAMQKYRNKPGTGGKQNG